MSNLYQTVRVVNGLCLLGAMSMVIGCPCAVYLSCKKELFIGLCSVPILTALAGIQGNPSPPASSQADTTEDTETEPGSEPTDEEKARDSDSEGVQIAD